MRTKSEKDVSQNDTGRQVLVRDKNLKIPTTVDLVDEVIFGLCYGGQFWSVCVTALCLKLYFAFLMFLAETQSVPPRSLRPV